MENKNQEKILGAIEALLFVYGEPLEIKRIVKILKRDPDLQIYLNNPDNDPDKSDQKMEEVIKEIIGQLNQRYLSEERGLRLIFSDERVQLVTKPQFASLLEDFIKEEFKENLTPASLETLSLIAYLGPLSRAQIDYYRGVNSSFTLRGLLIRGLIERFLDPQKSNTYLYQLSFDSLKYLGISRVEELPEYEKFKNNLQLPISN